MAEAGSFAEKVKQQADIVRVVGEYVRLKKGGQNFTGLCPFHAEKSPSFAVHPTKQIYHCFGCGVGGDVFKFVMEMEKCAFPEAIRIVAEKCGISIPRPKERSPEERKENQQRTVLVEMHREAQTFFVKQLEGTLEGKAARAYLEDRGLDQDTIARFGIGYAPSGGASRFPFRTNRERSWRSERVRWATTCRNISTRPRRQSIRRATCSITWTARRKHCAGKTSRSWSKGTWTQSPWRERASAT